MIEDLRELVAGQRILIVSSNLFGYHERIIARLQCLGAQIVWLDGRPDNSFLTKTVLRYLPCFYKNILTNYYNNSIKNTFDQILVISPEYLSIDIVRNLKKQTNALRIILYMWDSFLNKKNVLHAMKYFDKILTFDSDDAKKLNISFRPLFFSSGNQCEKGSGNEIDISFIGTGHSDRVKILEGIKKQCAELNLSYYFYSYLQNKYIYYFHKVANKHFKNIKKTCFHFSHIDYDQYIKISENSKAIIDIEHPKQKGLTMRTFEALGKETKLITTNKDIINYDFYNPSNILVIDRLNPVIDKDFINADYQKLPANIYYKYSLDGWLEDIFAPPPL